MAPVCRFDDGLSSSGMPRSLIHCASVPRVTKDVLALLAVDLDVLGDAHAVAEAQGPAVEERAADGLEAVGLARVHGAGHPLARQQVERPLHAGRREARLGPGDVEAHDAAVAVADGELRDLGAAVEVAHGADELADADGSARLLDAAHGLLDAGLHGLDRLVERQPAGEVLLRRPADLAVDDAVVRQVLDELAGDAREVLLRLHGGDGDVEGLQVLHERSRVGAGAEPLAERLGTRGGQLEADLVGDLDDRPGAEAAVEVVVQGDLGEVAERPSAGQRGVLGSDRHGTNLLASTRPTPR